MYTENRKESNDLCQTSRCGVMSSFSSSSSARRKSERISDILAGATAWPRQRPCFFQTYQQALCRHKTLHFSLSHCSRRFIQRVIHIADSKWATDRPERHTCGAITKVVEVDVAWSHFCPRNKSLSNDFRFYSSNGRTDVQNEQTCFGKIGSLGARRA